MFRTYTVISKHLAVVGISLALVAPFSGATAKDRIGTLHGYGTRYVFKGGSDGQGPYAGLLLDQAGNLYGTTSNGGDTSCTGYDGSGCGTVFEIKPDGTKIVLHSFTGGTDGAVPFGGVTADQGGNLYGTTSEGGGAGCGGYGCGTVFKVAPYGTETILHSFSGGKYDGAGPYAGLIIDKAGNLFGTTYGGGGKYRNGGGTAFKITPDGTETVMRIGGKNPEAGLVMDDVGKLYGTTAHGGDACGCGVVFKISPGGNTTTIYTFLGYPDGTHPLGSLNLDQAGNLYGTTYSGGNSGGGTVFEISPTGTETILYAFTGGGDGSGPRAGLVADHSGNLYGTTSGGGNGSGCGAVFKLAPNGAVTVLHDFRGGHDGCQPFSGSLIADQAGNIYGTTSIGGSKNCEGGGCGTIFVLRK